MDAPTSPNQTDNDFIADILRAIKSNTLKLPTLPEIAMKVRRAVESEDVSAGQIAKLIGTDVALSARLLQVANSPLYRGAKAIDSVQMAIARLGNKVVRNLVVSLVMQQLFSSKSELLKKRMQKLWEHSTQVAAICQVFAKKFTRLEPDQAMLAGLVHDIGALPVITMAENQPGLSSDAGLLEDALTKLHPSVGKLVMEAWKFSPELVAVAANHENLQYNSETADYVDVVIVANLHSYLGTNHRLAKINWSEVPAFGKLNLDADKSLAAMEEAKQEIAAMKALLGG